MIPVGAQPAIFLDENSLSVRLRTRPQSQSNSRANPEFR